MESVQSLVMNVNLEDLQYNMGQLYKEAQKLGLDECDLHEYGLDASISTQKTSCKQSTTNFIKYID